MSRMGGCPKKRLYSRGVSFSSNNKFRRENCKSAFLACLNLSWRPLRSRASSQRTAIQNIDAELSFSLFAKSLQTLTLPMPFQQSKAEFLKGYF